MASKVFSEAVQKLDGGQVAWLAFGTVVFVTWTVSDIVSACVKRPQRPQRPFVVIETDAATRQALLSAVALKRPVTATLTANGHTSTTTVFSTSHDASVDAFDTLDVLAKTSTGH